MPDDSVQNTGGQGIGINIPDSVKKNLPRDFNIDDIGKIDLREAEKIASEDILFLNEKDLAEGLEDLDLIPLKNMLREEEMPPSKPGAPRAPAGKDSAPKAAAPSSREALLSPGAKPEREESGVPLEYIEEAVVPDEDISKEAASPAGAPPVSPRKAEGYVEDDDEYVIWDMPDSEAGADQSKIKRASPAGEAPKPAAEVERARTEEAEKEKKADAAPQYHPDKDDVVISIEDLDEKAPPARKTVYSDLIPLEEIDAVPQSAPKVRHGRERIDRITVPVQEAVRDDIPGTGEVFFIDDKQHRDQEGGGESFDEGGLEKIASGIIQVDEGSSYVLEESDVLEDRELIAAVAEEYRPAYEELFVDLDYKYGDEELDYIHTAIVEEDYGSYIREIDEYSGTSRTVPAAVELLGLTADEFDTIEDLLFQGDFKDINMYDRYRLYEFDRATRSGSPGERKNCRYLLPDQNSLMADERDSIESDLSSRSALIFEEDVEDIKEQLLKRTGRKDVEAVHKIERPAHEKKAGPDVAPGAVHEKMPEKAPREDAPAAKQDASEQIPDITDRVLIMKKIPDKATGEDASAAKAAASEALIDITDRVVILNDEADVERFISEFPERKQMNIKMLLKYLDGLFETLPEEIIKKFASSEYFDLYLKVLNELGV
jgi:hypothetical protein